MFHSGSLVPCDAGVVSVVPQREIGYAQGAGEVDVVYGDTQVGWDGLAVLLPGDEDGLVTGHDHTGDEDPLANGKARELKRMDGGWNCGGDMQINFPPGVCSLRPTGYRPIILV